MKGIWIILFCFLLTPTIHAQVTNVESKRLKTDTTGWAGEVNTGFKFVREVGNVLSSNTDLRAQYKTKKDLYLALAEYNWSGARGQTFTHNAYVHLRYNRKLKPSWLRWEVFSQAQFNKITRINHRILTGTGPRFKLLGRDLGVIYFGSLYMFEHSKELDADDNHVFRNEHRLSTYLSYSIFPADPISIVSTTYYQPRFNAWRDFRVSHVSELRFQVMKRLVLSMVYKLNYDADPAVGISKITQSFENKIGVTF